MEIVSIFYNDYENIFEDEDGVEYVISSIMSNSDSGHYKTIGGIYCLDDMQEYIRYEVHFPSRSSDISLYYDEIENNFCDDYGIIVFNLFSIISTNDLYLFRKKKIDMTVNGVGGRSVELVYSNAFRPPAIPF